MLWLKSFYPNKNTMKLISNYYKLKQEVKEWFTKYYYEACYSDYLDDGYWIGNGDILWISDIFVSLENIIYLAEHQIPLDIFTDWYWYSVEEGVVNMQSYIKIRGTWDHDYFLSFQKEQEEKRKSPEFQKESQDRLEDMYAKWLTILAKYL